MWRPHVRKDVHTDGIPVLCASCEARHRGICGALEPEQLVSLAKTSFKHRAQNGTELVGDAEEIDSYANVLAGVVKLTKTLPDGRQQIVGCNSRPISSAGLSRSKARSRRKRRPTSLSAPFRAPRLRG